MYPEEFSYRYTGIGAQILTPKTRKNTFIYTGILF